MNPASSPRGVPGEVVPHVPEVALQAPPKYAASSFAATPSVTRWSRRRRAAPPSAPRRTGARRCAGLGLSKGERFSSSPLARPPRGATRGRTRARAANEATETWAAGARRAGGGRRARAAAAEGGRRACRGLDVATPHREHRERWGSRAARCARTNRSALLRAKQEAAARDTWLGGVDFSRLAPNLSSTPRRCRDLGFLPLPEAVASAPASSRRREGWARAPAIHRASAPSQRRAGGPRMSSSIAAFAGLRPVRTTRAIAARCCTWTPTRTYLTTAPEVIVGTAKLGAVFGTFSARRWWTWAGRGDRGDRRVFPSRPPRRSADAAAWRWAAWSWARRAHPRCACPRTSRRWPCRNQRRWS